MVPGSASAQTAEALQEAKILARVQKIELRADLVSATSAALNQITNVAAGGDDGTRIPHGDELAKFVLGSSSAYRSESGRYVILYATFADLYTIVRTNDRDRALRVFLVSGVDLNRTIGRGKVADNADFAVRLFRQRPRLQRDMAELLDTDQRAVETAMEQLQSDQKAAKNVLIGLELAINGLHQYDTLACKGALEEYRTSQTFGLNLAGGAAAVPYMKPVGVARISNVENVIFQDDQFRRETAFVEVSEPDCRIKQVRAFVAY